MSSGDRDGFFNAVAPLRELIDEVLSMADVRQDPIPTLPVAESQAMSEIADEHHLVCDEWGDNPIRHALGLATVLMAVAEDHLESLSNMYAPSESLSIFTPPVVLRSLLETLGRTHWLVDTSIGFKRRAGRGKTETVHNAHWQRLMLSGADRKAYDLLVDRRAVVVAAERMGYETGKRDDAWWIGEPRPSSRKAIDRLFTGIAGEKRPGTIFRHTSAIAHATLHGIFSSIEIDVDSSTALGGHMGQMGTSSDDVRAMLGVGLYGYLAVAHERRSWLGWLTPEWSDVRERCTRLVAEL
jgi:hypothetical protein